MPESCSPSTHPSKRRGFIASLVGLGTNCGTLFASGIWAILLGVMVESDVIAWGWRIPFIASAVVMVFAVWVRLNLKESPGLRGARRRRRRAALSREEIARAGPRPVDVRTLEAMQRKPIKAIVVAFFLRFGQAGNSGLIQTYLISFMTLTLALQKSLSANVVIVSSLVGFLTIPLVGWLGDRFGRRRMYIIVMSSALVVDRARPCWRSTRKNLLWVFVGYVVLHNVAVLSLGLARERARSPRSSVPATATPSPPSSERSPP